MCYTLLAQDCRTKILQGFTYLILLVDQFGKDNLLCTITDAVHGSNPCHLVSCFQCLCHALRILHLLNNDLQTALCLLVQVGQISPQFSGQAKVIKADRMMFPQILSVHPSLTANGSGFFRQANIGNIVVATTNIVQFLHHMYRQ